MAGLRALLSLTAYLILGLAVAGCGGGDPQEKAAGKTDSRAVRPLRMGVMPKLMGINYFDACQQGAEHAAEELGVDLTYDGPAVDSVEQQAQMVDQWIALGYDVIAVAPNDPEVIAPALRRAKDAGIAVLTWDADANATASGRATFVNQASVEAIGNLLVDILAEGIGGRGKAVIVTGSATSPNQNAWRDVMQARLAARYPEIALLETLVPEEDQGRARQMTLDVLNAHPDLAGVWGITSVSLPGAAEAVRQAGKSGEVFVTGLSLPNTMREYVEDGTVPRFVLWNPVDLGYLTVHVGKALFEGTLSPGEQSFGRLEGIQVSEGEVLLGPPMVFDKDNVDQFDF